MTAASARSIRCPQCAVTLDPMLFVGGTWVECPVCRSQLTSAFFPAFENPPPAISSFSGERALEGEAACFFHPEKRAILACESCGRFLCALCDLPFGTRHLCPACLEARKPAELLNRRMCWSLAALLVGVLPLLISILIWPFLVFTGPIAIFLALWGWRKPGSLVHGSRHWAAIVGLLGGVIQVSGVIAFIVFLWSMFRNG